MLDFFNNLVDSGRSLLPLYGNILDGIGVIFFAFIFPFLLLIIFILFIILLCVSVAAVIFGAIKSKVSHWRMKRNNQELHCLCSHGDCDECKCGMCVKNDE